MSRARGWARGSGWPQFGDTTLLREIQIDSKNYSNLEEKWTQQARPTYNMRATIMLKPVSSDDSAGTSSQEAKRDKFVKLAEGRTRNAIAAIRVIGKLGNKNAYDFDDADVQKIVRALAKEVDALKARMSSSTGKETIDFKL
jgi:hypothetical protein